MPENYKLTDPSVFMQRYEASQARRTGMQRGWKLKQGPPGRPVRSVVRIMPGHVNMVDEFIEMKVHFNLGPQQNTAAPCLEPYAVECPGCQWAEELFSKARRSDPTTGKELRDLAFKVRAKMRFGCQIVDMAHPEQGVQEFFFSDELEKKLRSCFLDDQDPPQYRNIAHPQTGRDVVIEVSTKPNTEWPSFDVVRAKDTPSPLADMGWLDQIRDMTAEHVYQPTLEEVRGALQGQRITRGMAQAAPSRPGLAPASAPRQAALPAAPATPSTPTPAPTPAAPVGRRAAAPGRPAAAPAPAPTPLPPSTAQAPTPAAPTPSRRQPAVAPSAMNGYAAAYTRAKAEILKVFASPKDITEDELAGTPKPPCYTLETEPTDPACQSCSVLIPCYGALRKYWTPAT